MNPAAARAALLVASLTLAAAAPPGVAAATAGPLVAAASSELVLEGSSNLGGWRCRASEIEARAELAIPLAELNLLIDRIESGDVAPWLPLADRAGLRAPSPSFALRTPVAGLRCGSAAMERDLRRALHADRHPAVDYRFRGVLGGVTHDLDRGLYRARVGGVLSLAGAAREVELVVEVRRLAPDRFALAAELPLRMTDFGVAPPTALLGLIRAADALRVRFDLVLEAIGGPEG